MLIINYFGSFSDTVQHSDCRLHHNENLFISTFWRLFWEMTAMSHGQFHVDSLLVKLYTHSTEEKNILQIILKPHYAQHM